MLWVCLQFPQLALDAVSAGADASSHAAPFAVIDGPPQRRQVVLANAPARNMGVRAGQTLAGARMLCPRLAAAPRDEAAERQALESLAAWAYRFSAEISPGIPHRVLLEAGASLALFGGWAALERRLRSDLGSFGFACSLAAAPTATGACVLATHADGIAIMSTTLLANALGGVALAASGLDAKTVSALQGMGFRHLRDLFRLPRAELARRVGEDALDHLDRMRGLAAEALPRWRPPQRFERRIEFSFGIESHPALAFPLQRLIRELATFLVARDGGVQRFTLVLGHEHGASTRVGIDLLAPQRDATSLFELARVRLERVELAAPVHALSLLADDLPPLCPLHRDLFDTNRREQLDWPALAERLRARLGDPALRGVARAADHRPGRAWRFVAAIETATSRGKGCRDAGAAAAPRKNIAPAAAPAESPTPQPATTVDVSAEYIGKTRPFWLLRRPIVLRGTPVRILAGPERIESGWWDERDQRRDYYLVETRGGQRAWAFVEAGTASAIDPRHATRVTVGWMLHGWFA